MSLALIFKNGEVMLVDSLMDLEAFTMQKSALQLKGCNDREVHVLIIDSNNIINANTYNSIDDILLKISEFIVTHPEFISIPVLFCNLQISSDVIGDYLYSHEQNYWLISNWQKDQLINFKLGEFAAEIGFILGKDYDLNNSLAIARRNWNASWLWHMSGISEKDIPIEIFKPWMMPTIVSDLSLPMKLFRFQAISSIGLYPVVDSYAWVKQLIEYGVTTIQLRIKNDSEVLLAALEAEIEMSITLARKHDIKLFINDYWQLAIKYHAYGVHLGQEDLAKADLRAIFNAGIRLGISTHSHFELAVALSYQPSYIALGPVFHTTSKQMAFAPQGTKRIKEWQQLIDCPLVTIGGINQENIDAVIEAGNHNIALISAICANPDPKAVTKHLLAKINGG